MNFKIHRGTQEIGGSCVEVWTENTRILIDFGMPLVEKNGDEFNFHQYKDISIKELVQKGVIPEIDGLYRDLVKPTVNGVLISHAHQDHFGLTNYIHPDVNFFLSRATHKIIEMGNIFTPQNIQYAKPNYFEREKTFQLGDFSITPYWNDHSAYDAHSFLIEADGKSIFYSGDFRGHGRKSGAFKWFLHNSPQNVDYLLLEGTNVGKGEDLAKTEQFIEEELLDKFSEQGKINLIYTSGQNFDRLVSIYRACIRTNKTLVLDVYVASILKALSRFGTVPYPSRNFKNIKVIFTKYTTNKLTREGNQKYFFQFQPYKITKEEIDTKACEIVMVVRPSMTVDLDPINGIDGGNFIYSMWSGYIAKPDSKTFVDYLKRRNFSIIEIHTSGHADSKALKQMADAIQPKHIVPIHTFNSSDYEGMFNYPVAKIMDGEIIQV